MNACRQVHAAHVKIFQDAFPIGSKSSPVGGASQHVQNIVSVARGHKTLRAWLRTHTAAVTTKVGAGGHHLLSSCFACQTGLTQVCAYEGIGWAAKRSSAITTQGNPSQSSVSIASSGCSAKKRLMSNVSPPSTARTHQHTRPARLPFWLKLVLKSPRERETRILCWAWVFPLTLCAPNRSDSQPGSLASSTCCPTRADRPRCTRRSPQYYSLRGASLTLCACGSS